MSSSPHSRLSPRELEGASIRKGALQKPGELEALIRFLRGRKAPKVVLEIGTCEGGTLWLWGQLAAADALIVSVDLPGGDFGGGYPPEDVPRLLTYTTRQQDIRLFRDDSHDPQTLESVKRFLAGRKVDLLFLDGDHTLEGVTKDWEMYSPLVGSGGLVVFHDIVEHTTVPTCQVKPLWDELKSEYPCREFCNGGVWGGIGVLSL